MINLRGTHPKPYVKFRREAVRTDINTIVKPNGKLFSYPVYTCSECGVTHNKKPMATYCCAEIKWNKCK